MSKYLSGVRGSAFSLNSTTGTTNSTALSSVYSASGVYTGLNSGSPGIELVGASNGNSYIDFTAVNVDYKGRIGYDNNANLFGFYTNSSLSATIDTNGNFEVTRGYIKASGLISSSSPTGSGIIIGMDGASYANIQLNGGTSTTAGSYIDFSYSGVDYKGRISYDNNPNILTLHTNGLASMTIDPNGNTDITRGYCKAGGTLSSSYSVSGVYTGLNSGSPGIELVGASNGNSYIDFTAVNVDYKGRIGYDNSTNSFGIFTNSSLCVTIDPSGNFDVNRGYLKASGSISASPVGSGVFMGIDSSGYSHIQLNSGTNTTLGSYIDFAYSGNDFKCHIVYDNNSNILYFYNGVGGASLQMYITTTIVYIPGGLKVNNGYFTSSSSANARFDGPGIAGDSGTKTVVAEFSGYIMAQGYYSYSDRRLKEDIQPITTDVYSSIQELNPVTYNFIDKTKSNKLQYGLIAQEVEKIYPDIVNNTPGYIPDILSAAIVIRPNIIKLACIKDYSYLIDKNILIYIKEIDSNENTTVNCNVLSVCGEYLTIDSTLSVDSLIFVYGVHDNEVKSINYESLIPLLIANAKEQYQKIDIIQDKIDQIIAYISYMNNSNTNNSNMNKPL